MHQVVGQQVAKNGLINMWEGNHLPHAMLFLGADGTGGLPLALAFAQYIFCSNKENGASCGHCANCHKCSRLEHADLHVSFPAISPKSGAKALSRYYIQEFREFITQSPYGSTYDWLQFINAENKQGNIPAEECREIIDHLSLKSYEGGMKVQIIWRPEYLGKEGNILLKLIEEPPPSTLLILVAEETENMLPTILSRTQVIRLSPVAPADIAQGLADRNLADPRRAAQVAHIANGNFREALRLIRHTENDLFPELRRWFNALFTNNGIELSRFVDDWSKVGREQQKNFLQYVIQMLEHTLRARYLPQVAPALQEDEARFVMRLAAQPLTVEALEQIIEITTQISYHIERNAHGKTQLLALSIQVSRIIQGRKLVLH